MGTRTTTIMAALLLGACGQGDAASGRQKAGTSERRLEVAGVRVGMPSAELLAALKAGGWKAVPAPGPDWAAKVEEEVDRQRGVMWRSRPRRGITLVDARKGDETLSIELQPVPTGSVATLVRYEAPMSGRTPAQLAAELGRRYGAPTLATNRLGLLSATWCQDRCRHFDGAQGTALKAEAQEAAKLKLLLREGVVAEKARAGQLQAAVGQRMPAKSSF